MSRSRKLPPGVSRAAKGYRIRWDGVPTPDGKRNAKTEVLVGIWDPNVAATVREANIRRVQRATDPRAFFVSTVGELIDQFRMEKYRGNSFSFNTRRAYDDLFECLLRPTFGDVLVIDMTPALIQSAVEKWQVKGSQSGGPLGPKRVRSAHGLLHRLLKDARVRGVIGGNPSDGTELPRWDPEGGRAVGTRYMARFVAALRDPTFRDAALTMWSVGLRPGEMIRLRVEDFLPARGILMVRRASDGAGGTKRPKDLEPRALPVPEDLAALLRVHIGRLRSSAAEFGDGYRWDLGLLFPRADGSAITGKQLRLEFKRASRLAELPYEVRPKDMRPSWATLSDAQAVDEDEVDAIREGMGHSSWLTTDTHYIDPRYLALAEEPVRLPKARQRAVARRMNERVRTVLAASVRSAAGD